MGYFLVIIGLAILAYWPLTDNQSWVAVAIIAIGGLIISASYLRKEETNAEDK